MAGIRTWNSLGRAVYVFDVEQTEGKDLPALTEVQGDVNGYRERLVKFVESQKVTLGSPRLSGRLPALYSIFSGLRPWQLIVGEDNR